jgi:hypothetical protein
VFSGGAHETMVYIRFQGVRDHPKEESYQPKKVVNLSVHTGNTKPNFSP